MIDHVQLRTVIDTDLPIFFEQQRDPEATRMAAFPSRERNAFSEQWARILANETVLRKTILFEDRVAGNIGSWAGSAWQEVDCSLGGDFWGMDIATLALAEFLHSIETGPLYAYVVKHNIASRRVLDKCGLTICGSELIPPQRGKPPFEELTLKLDASESDKTPWFARLRPGRSMMLST